MFFCMIILLHCQKKRKKKKWNPRKIHDSCFHICIHDCRPGVVSAVEEFKLSVYGDNYDEEKELVGNGKASETSKKRKAIADNAVKESANYDWDDLADNGKVKFKYIYYLYFIPSGLFWSIKEKSTLF